MIGLLQKAQNLFLRLVDRIEGDDAPLSRYFLLFFAILAVRLCLEFFSTQRLFSLDDVLHIGLWFTFIVLAFLVQLHLFAGTPIRRVGRLVVVSFTIALTAPIIDLILRGGIGAKMNYLSIHSWQDVFTAYLTVGGASLSRGATLGIRIEIVLLVIASWNYLRTRTGSLLRATLGTLCVYTILFLSGTVPRLLGWIVDTLHLTYQPDDNSTVLFLLCLDLALVAVVLLRHNPVVAGQLLRQVSWVGFVSCTAAFTIAAKLAREAYPGNWQLDPTTFFHFPLMLALGLLIALLHGLSRREPNGMAPATSALIRNGLSLLIGLIGLAISQRMFFMVAVVWGLIFLQNERPLRLRNAPMLRNMLEAMTVLAAALAGFVAFGGPMIGMPGEWIGAVALLGFLSSLVREFQRREQDWFPWLSTWGQIQQRVFHWSASGLYAMGSTAAAAWMLAGEWDLGIHEWTFYAMLLLIGVSSVLTAFWPRYVGGILGATAVGWAILIGFAH